MSLNFYINLVDFKPQTVFELSCKDACFFLEGTVHHNHLVNCPLGFSLQVAVFC